MIMVAKSERMFFYGSMVRARVARFLEWESNLFRILIHDSSKVRT